MRFNTCDASLEEQLVKAHVEAKYAWDYGATEEQMNSILRLIRHSQWRWDYAVAAHGSSFHSPVEVSRIIATGIHQAQEARIMLARLLAALGHNETVPMPDISTKEKAQAYIGLDMKELYQEKEEFLEKVIPVWEKEAAAREENYPVEDLE